MAFPASYTTQKGSLSLYQLLLLSWSNFYQEMLNAELSTWALRIPDMAQPQVLWRQYRLLSPFKGGLRKQSYSLDFAVLWLCKDAVIMLMPSLPVISLADYNFSEEGGYVWLTMGSLRTVRIINDMETSSPDSEGQVIGKPWTGASKCPLTRHRHKKNVLELEMEAYGWPGPSTGDYSEANMLVISPKLTV